ncbi:MAG: hypothetical protein QM775_30665 [Pirellulales bacterium]
MTCWNIEQDLARLTSTTLAAEVDLRRPDAGLHRLAIVGQALAHDLRMLAVGVNEASAWELSVAESYARGLDLVATYPQTAARPYRVQAYWRFVELPASELLRGAACVELQVSINTSLLDTAPLVEIGDDLGAGEVVVPAALENCATILRPTGAAWSYVRLVHPVDRGAATNHVATLNTNLLRLPLFGRYLEKGVIMRTRTHGAIVPRANDEAAAVEIFKDFLHAPLPLTT